MQADPRPQKLDLCCEALGIAESRIYTLFPPRRVRRIASCVFPRAAGLTDPIGGKMEMEARSNITLSSNDFLLLIDCGVESEIVEKALKGFDCQSIRTNNKEFFVQ